MARGRDVAIGIGAALLGAVAMFAATGGATAVGTTDKAAIEKIVRDYILANPEILPEAMERLQAKEAAKAIAANRNAIETPFGGAWEGAKNGDVVLAQFFDYACGYCRASLPVVDRLLKEDPKLKVVYRELPVLGPDSEAAAHLSLAVAAKGRYAEFHRALYAEGRLDAAARAKLASRFGVSAAPTPASRGEIGKNQSLQGPLRISGTPTWVVGDRVVYGAVGYDELKAAIATARSARLAEK
jgi:protein-disulfide isomerase